MRIETDVLIIGGGVAGSAMAACLTDKGYKVVLVEKSEKPLIKVYLLLFDLLAPKFMFYTSLLCNLPKTWSQIFFSAKNRY